MNVRLPIFLLFVALLATVASAPAFAQSLDSLSAEQRGELERELERARVAYESGDFATARDAFERVYALFPSADVLYKLALCYERLGEFERAVQSYRDYLVKVPDDPERPRIEGVIRTLRERMEQRGATLVVALEPADASVYVDGAERLEQPDADGTRTLELPAGNHEVTIRRPGYKPQERTLQLRGDQRYDLIVALSPVAESRGPRTLGWGLAGGGAAVLLAGGTTLGMALGTGQALQTQYEARDTSRRPPAFDTLEQRYNRLVVLGWTLTGIGAAATAAGAFLLIRSGGETALSVAPALTPGSIGVVGTF